MTAVETDLSLSLYQIESDLAQLVRMREEVRETLGENATPEDIAQELQAIDNAIRQYVRAEIRKADSIADYLLTLDRLAGEPKQRKEGTIRCELDLEIDRLRERRDALRTRAEHLKEIVKAVMSGMDWKPGKPRKLEGLRHNLRLVGNGGVQPLVITDESLIPDDLCVWVGEIDGPAWRYLERLINSHPNFARSVSASVRMVRQPSNAAVRARLSEKCASCNGSGSVLKAEDVLETVPCSECNGTGKRLVAGASLGERGESLRVE